MNRRRKNAVSPSFDLHLTLRPLEYTFAKRKHREIFPDELPRNLEPRGMMYRIGDSSVRSFHTIDNPRKSMKCDSYKQFSVQSFSFLLILIIALKPPLFGQSSWTYRPTSSTISLAYFSPSFAQQPFSQFVQIQGWTMVLSGRVSLSERTYFVAAVPYLHSSMTFPPSPFTIYGSPATFGQDKSESKIGNPYIGLEFGGAGSAVKGEIGLHPKVYDENSIANISAGLSDIDLLEMCIADYYSIQGGVNFLTGEAIGFVGKARLGASHFIPTNDGGTSQTLVDYSAGVGYRGEIVDMGFLYAGRTVTTGETLVGSRKGVNYLTISIGARFESIRPEVSYKMPLDDEMKQITSYILGLGIAVEL